MRSKKLWLSGLLILTCGCSSMNNTEKGLLGGAAVGTGAGALIGRGNPAAMALGGIGGAAIGGIAGSAQDAREDRKKAYAAAEAAANAQAARQMSINEIVQMAQQRQSDAVIIGQINTTGSIFRLTSDDVNYLHQQGVSDQVINYMQQPRYVAVQPRPVVIYERPYVYPPPPPPPPVYVEPGVSIGVRGRF
jgi:hypothetical protein